MRHVAAIEKNNTTYYMYIIGEILNILNSALS